MPPQFFFPRHCPLCGLSPSSFLLSAWALFLMPWGSSACCLLLSVIPHFAHRLSLLLFFLIFWRILISQIWPCPATPSATAQMDTCVCSHPPGCFLVCWGCIASVLSLKPQPLDFQRLRAGSVTFLLPNLPLLPYCRRLGLVCVLQVWIAHFCFAWSSNWATQHPRVVWWFAWAQSSSQRHGSSWPHWYFKLAHQLRVPGALLVFPHVHSLRCVWHVIISEILPVRT